MTMTANTNPNEVSRLALIRRTFGVTQSEFAARMGVPLRTLQDLEAGKSAFRMVHLHAAEFAVMQIALATNQVSKLPDHLKELAVEIAGKLNR